MTGLVFVPLSEVERAEIGRWPGTRYEGWVRDLLGHGWSVPWGPGACGVPGCGHGQVWHRAKTRLHRCDVAGCACQAFADQRARRVPAAAPEDVPAVAREIEDVPAL